MGVLGLGVPLLVLLADVEQSDLGAGAAEHVAHEHGAEIGEPHHLTGAAVDVGPRIEDQHRQMGGGKQGAHRRSLDAVMQAELHRGASEDGAGIPRGHEGIGPIGGLKAQADHDAGARLPAQGGDGLLVHPHHVRRVENLESGTIEARVVGQFGLDHRLAADQLQPQFGELGERQQRTLDFRVRCVVAPHRVQSDADHRQASSTSISFLPR